MPPEIPPLPATPRLAGHILPVIVFLVLVLLAAWAVQHFYVSPPVPSATGSHVFSGISNHPDQDTIPISMQCGACHEKIFQEWADSDHAWAHRGLNPKWDAEAFHGLPLEAHGTTTHFSTNEEGDRILTDKKNGKTWKMDMAIGRVPLVQYLTRGADGGYHTTSAAWDVRKREWFDMFGSDSRSPGEWGHWTGKGMIWNTQCAWCHMSGFRKKYDTDTHTYHSTWLEPGITCIQCHGPLLKKAEAGTGCMIDTSRKYSIKQQADNCASCHARRDELDNTFEIGNKFEDHFILSLPTQPGLYWPNGMQRDEVYTETGLKLSRMGKAGVQCLDCHNAHTAKLKFPYEDNSLCLQCHEKGERNAPVIDPLHHSQHKSGSTGNLCVECHMPETNYMVRDPRRDHTFCSPDPLLSRELDMPNSCNMCHKDKSVEWSEKYVKEWYGDLPLTSRRERSRAVDKAFKGREEAFPELLVAYSREENPAWKATLLELLDPWGTTPEVTALAQTAAKSEHPMERVAAAKILGQTKSRAIVPLLADPVKTVRVQAAWSMRDMLGEDSRAMKELEASALHQGDQPGGAMKLAQIYAARAVQHQKTPPVAAEWNKKAEAWFRKAREWDPSSAVVHRDFAVFLATQNRPQDAINELNAAVKLEPANPQLYYLLGLAEAESGNTAKAVESLDKALEIDSLYARAAYNRALLKNSLGKLEEALSDLDIADKAEPVNPDHLYTKAVLLYQNDRILDARKVLIEMRKRFPSFAPANQLWQQMQ